MEETKADKGIENVIGMRLVAIGNKLVEDDSAIQESEECCG